MRLNEVYSARSIALNQRSDQTNSIPFLGEGFFPSDKKMGIDLKQIKTRKGAGVALKPSAYDALATIRPRNGFSVLSQEMPLFRESMKVGERELADIMRAQESTDPYLNDVLATLYDDAGTLIEGSRISKEKMRMSLLCPKNGKMLINVAADNAFYEYDYDADGKWAEKHYLALAGDNTWDKATATPLTDIEDACTFLRGIGETPEYILMNSTTFGKLVGVDQIKAALVTISGQPIAYVDKNTVKSVIETKTGLKVLLYDKTYKDDVAESDAKKFFADGYVTILPSNTVGKTWHGVSPEERTLMGDPKVNVAIIETGVAVSIQDTYGPPVQHSTTVSMICLPSFEGMDGVYTFKVF